MPLPSPLTNFIPPKLLRILTTSLEVPEIWIFGLKSPEMKTVLFEIEGVPEELAREAFSRASAKLPVGTVFAKREVL